MCVFRVGGTEVELVEPLGPQGESIRRFLRRRGEGIHHICLEVEDIRAELRRLQDEGFIPIDQPRRGSLGRTVAFLRPTRGVLIELVETRHAEQPLEDKPD